MLFHFIMSSASFSIVLKLVWLNNLSSFDSIPASHFLHYLGKIFQSRSPLPIYFSSSPSKTSSKPGVPKLCAAVPPDLNWWIRVETYILRYMKDLMDILLLWTTLLINFIIFFFLVYKLITHTIFTVVQIIFKSFLKW